MRHIVHITGLWHHRLKTVKLFLEPICVRFRVAKSPFLGAQFSILDGVAYAVLAQIESSETDAGTLETCTVTVQQGEDTVTSMQTACYRPERSAP